MILKMRTGLIMLACISLIAPPTWGQHEATLHFMSSLPQASYNNPAFQPRYKFSLGLPGSSVYGQYANNGFTYADVLINGGDGTEMDLGKLYGSAKNKNFITTAVQADLLRFSVKINARMHLNWNLTTKGYSRLMAPKSLLDFAHKTSESLEDNASLDLTPFSISPRAEALAYLESGLGASYIVDKKLTVGARIKLLKGIANATTRSANFILEVNNDYATAIADLNVKTSGINQWSDDDFDIEKDWAVYKKNTGFAFDLGSTYQVTDKLMVGASLIDIGSITWKNDPYGYRLDPEKNKVTFRMMTPEDVSNGDEDAFKAMLDSLENAEFSFEEGRIAKYRSPVPGKMYLSGSYALKRTLSAGVVLFAEKFKGRFSTGGSASVYKEFGRKVSTSLSYTITNHSYNNIGAGLTLNFLPVQFYIVGDNLLRAPMALMADGNFDSYINNSKYINVRAGFNFVFGWIKTQEKLPHPRKI